MELILDLAVAALALVVIGSLATLAWTLAVSAVRATVQRREQVAIRRRWVTDAEVRLPSLAARADAVLVEAIGRTAPQAGTAGGTDDAVHQSFEPTGETRDA